MDNSISAHPVCSEKLIPELELGRKNQISSALGQEKVSYHKFDWNVAARKKNKIKKNQISIEA